MHFCKYAECLLVFVHTHTERRRIYFYDIALTIVIQVIGDVNSFRSTLLVHFSVHTDMFIAFPVI